MDKTEYGIKLDQINSLAEKQDFQGALEIVETIDWRRVKSIRTLCMVADIYEANRMLEESKEILILAYNRTSAGRAILYRLVEISLKLQQIDESVEYYTEYVKIARGDNAKYLLKYKIYKARRATVEEQIVILEDYKSREYTERWAYELARLYDKAGMQDKCIDECDDLILWFSEGKYVLKAMELKMNYTPLSPSQQSKYLEIRDYAGEPKPVAAPAYTASTTPKAPEGNMPAAELGGGTQEAAVTAERYQQPAEAAGVSYEQPLRQSSENIQERLAMSFRDVLSGLNRVKDEAAVSFGASQELEASAEEEAEDVGEYHVIKDLEPEELGRELSSYQQKAEAEPVREVQQPKAEPVEESAEPEIDISKILEETANNIARQVGKEQAWEAIAEETPLLEEEPAVADIEIETPVETVVELEEDAEPQKDEEQEPAETISAGNIGDTQEFDLEEQLSLALEESNKQEERSKKQEESAAKPEPVEAEEEIRTVEETEAEEEIPAAEEPEEAEAPKEELSIEEQILREESSEEKRVRILNDTRPDKLSDEQRQLFSYFAKVPGMDQQLLEAMYGVYAYAGERTSKRGNIAVMGGSGTGKTRLSDGLIKAICKDLGLEAVKFACLDGNKLNDRDPAKVVAKLSGGFLLIERAGAMTAETIAKLSHAMEFRTDSMVVIIEDEKRSMRALLEEYPDFAKKFEKVISIPVFTNDELVSFARSYAKELNYKIDEMGVLALYTLIGEEQTEEQPIIISQVKELVDGAISKAQKGTRKFSRKLSARGTDEEGRTILFEKDFDF